GDTLQFIRFAPMVKGRTERVVVLCQGPLVQLVARCPGVDLAFDAASGYEPACQSQSPLMSLPSIFGTTLETVPAHVPYLFNDPQRIERWRLELARSLGARAVAEKDSEGVPAPKNSAITFLIGVVWQGNPDRQDDRWRSFPLAKLAPLARIPGVR